MLGEHQPTTAMPDLRHWRGKVWEKRTGGRNAPPQRLCCVAAANKLLELRSRRGCSTVALLLCCSVALLLCCSVALRLRAADWAGREQRDDANPVYSTDTSSVTPLRSHLFGRGAGRTLDQRARGLGGVAAVVAEVRRQRPLMGAPEWVAPF